MANPLTQDVRASQVLLFTDGILENNPVIDQGPPIDYQPYDDSLYDVHVNIFRDPDNVYFYVPAGARTTQQRVVDRNFIENWVKGLTVVIHNDYQLMTLNEPEGGIAHWEYTETHNQDRIAISNIQPVWRGYNMVSQWYWLSTREMLDKKREYIECASWSVPKVDIADIAKLNQMTIFDVEGGGS